MRTLLILALGFYTGCMTVEPASYEEQVAANLAQSVMILTVCHQRQVEDGVANPNYCGR